MTIRLSLDAVIHTCVSSFTLLPLYLLPPQQDPQTQVADIVTDIFALSPTPGMRVVSTTTTIGAEAAAADEVAMAGGVDSEQNHHDQQGDGNSAAPAPVMAEASAAAAIATTAAAVAAAHSFATAGSVDRNEFDATLSPKPDIIVDGPVELEAFATAAAATEAAASSSTAGTDDDSAGLHGRGWLSTEDAMGMEVGQAPVDSEDEEEAGVQAAVASEGEGAAASSDTAAGLHGRGWISTDDAMGMEIGPAPTVQAAVDSESEGVAMSTASLDSSASVEAEGAFYAEDPWASVSSPAAGWGLPTSPPLFSHELTDSAGSLSSFTMDSEDGSGGGGDGID